MNAKERPKLQHGIIGGIAGGLVFAGIMVINGTLTDMGMTLPLIGSIVGRESAWIGFGVHMLSSAIIGAGYVIAFGWIEKGMLDGLHFGMIYGAIWWFLGELTLMPLLLGKDIASQWTLTESFRLFPSLISHLVYGAILGMTVGAFRDLSLAVPEEEPRTLTSEELSLEESAPEAAETGGEKMAPAEETEHVSRVEEELEAPPLIKNPRIPLWMSVAIMALVFLMNLAIFGYAVKDGLPRASESHEAESH
jgi:hypothetical protein